MSEKQYDLSKFLSNLLIIIIAIILVVSATVFIKGQMDANKAIVDAGAAVANSVYSSSSTQDTVDYKAAIAYLEATQQTYSENSIIKITSLIYALSSSIILGYGAKMLRLGASDKQELCKELLEKTEDQFNTSADRILQQQNSIYTATTLCENASLLALLLTSHFELSNNQATTARSDIEYRLQVELAHSLRQFENFLSRSCVNKNDSTFTKGQVEMIKRTWAQAQRSVNEYITPHEQGKSSCLEKSFGKYDQKMLSDIVTEIQQFITNL